MIEGEGWPEREMSAPEQFRYLFGDPRVRADTGLLGRFAKAIDDLDAKVSRLLRLAYALLTVLVAALLALAANLIAHL